MAQLVFVDEEFIHKSFSNLSINENQTDYDEFGDIMPSYKYSILSFDVGIKNLGLSLSITDEAFNLIRIEWVKNIDIREYTHEHDLYDKQCNIDHNSNNIADWLSHIFLEYETLFNLADFILVEKQPPQGLVVVEQIILFKYRHKTILIHPKSMHTFFNISNNSYKDRKKLTMLIAEKNCVWHQRAIASYNSYKRKHDMSDAICLLLYWLRVKNKEYTKQMNYERMKNLPLPSLNGMSAIDWLESHRYIQY